MDRYFAYLCCIYDSDNPLRRAPFNHPCRAMDQADKMNQGVTDPEMFTWCNTGEHADLHGKWAPSELYVTEYALALQVLGEDYFG